MAFLARDGGLQQPTTAPAQTSSPVATVTVRPSEAAIQVGDTIRLAASARDSAGRPRNDVAIRWFQSGGHFEGKVDSTGLVTGGATGTITVTALVESCRGRVADAGFRTSDDPVPTGIAHRVRPRGHADVRGSVPDGERNTLRFER